MTTVRELAEIVESAHDAIFSKTLDGTVTSWNFGAERMYGYGEKEMVGQNVRKLAPPGREGEIDSILARLARGEIIDHFTTKRQRKDGVVIDVSLMISPIRDKQGNVIAASTVAREITEEVAARQQRHRRQIGAYVVVVILGVVGFFRAEQISHKIDTESRARSFENCQAVVRSNTVLRALIDKSAAPITPPANASPELRQVFADANQRAATFGDFARKLLADPDCKSLEP